MTWLLSELEPPQREWPPDAKQPDGRLRSLTTYRLVAPALCVAAIQRGCWWRWPTLLTRVSAYEGREQPASTVFDSTTWCGSNAALRIRCPPQQSRVS